MVLNIVQAGLSTTVQDLGRPGYYHLGIPLSGGMDRYALRAANLLVGNSENAAVLEAVFTGPEIVFEAPATIAVTGAQLPPQIDGEEQPCWTALSVAAGQRLSFGFLQAGARAYIAFSGGIDVPLVLGSRSTYALGGLGGYQGRPLQAGDRLSLGAAPPSVAIGQPLPPALCTTVAVDEQIRLRMLPGLYWHWITAESGRQFLQDVWQVAPEADRIGYRFRGGHALRFAPRERPFGAGSDPSNIVDSCYPYGSIQVPGGSEPIVLHRDAVSGGGYFMLGVVISADMDQIGQLQPHTAVSFDAVDMAAALAARALARQRLESLRKALH